MTRDTPCPYCGCGGGTLPWPQRELPDAADRVKAADDELQRVSTGGTRDQIEDARGRRESALTHFVFLCSAVVFLFLDMLRRAMDANPRAVDVQLSRRPSEVERDRRDAERDERLDHYGELIRELQEELAELRLREGVYGG